MEEKTTPDWAFKVLGYEEGVQIIEPYEELPNFPVQLFDIAVSTQRFVAAGKKQLVVGSVSDLYDCLTKTKEPKQVLKSIDHVGILLVEILANENQCAVYDQNNDLTMYSLDGKKQWSIQVAGIKSLAARPGHNSVTYVADNTAMLVEDGTVRPLGTGNLFSWQGSEKYVLATDQVELWRVESSGNKLEKTLSLPSDAKALFVRCFGEHLFMAVESSDLKYESYLSTEGSWSEIPEACMPFADEERETIWYTIDLSDWISQEPFLFTAACANSADIVLASTKYNLQPEEDADRAVLPFVDRDTTPVGYGLSAKSKTAAKSPFSSIEGQFHVPVVWLLNNMGHILAWQLFSQVALTDSSTMNVVMPCSGELTKPTNVDERSILNENEVLVSAPRSSPPVDIKDGKSVDATDVSKTTPSDTETSEADLSTASKRDLDATDSGSEYSRDKSEPEPDQSSGAREAEGDSDDQARESEWESEESVTKSQSEDEEPKRASPPSRNQSERHQKSTSESNDTAKKFQDIFGKLAIDKKSRSAEASHITQLPEKAREGGDTGKGEGVREAEAAKNLEEVRKAEEIRKAAKAQKAAAAAEGARQAEEARKEAGDRQAEDARKAAEAQQAEDARKAEEARKAAEARQAEKARKAAEAQQAEEARNAAEARQAEETRKAAEARKAAELEKRVTGTDSDFKSQGFLPFDANVPEDLSDLDEIYSTTNSLFQVVGHNLQFLRARRSVQKSQITPPKASLASCSVTDSVKVRDHLNAVSEELSKSNISKESIDQVDQLAQGISDMLRSVDNVAVSVANLSREVSAEAFESRALPLRAARLQNELRSKYKAIMERCNKAEEASMLLQLKSGSVPNVANIAVCIDILDDKIRNVNQMLTKIASLRRQNISSHGDLSVRDQSLASALMEERVLRRNAQRKRTAQLASILAGRSEDQIFQDSV